MWTRYFNNRAWTEDVFLDRERIDCSIQIILNEAEGLSLFRGEIVVRASRPIYGTAQPTTLLLISDNSWNFTYTRGQSLVYDPERYDAFLSVLDFYAFTILGYDYDWFFQPRWHALLRAGPPHRGAVRAPMRVPSAGAMSLAKSALDSTSFVNSWTRRSFPSAAATSASLLMCWTTSSFSPSSRGSRPRRCCAR